MTKAKRYDLIELCLNLTKGIHDINGISDELLVEYTNESFPDLKLTVDEYKKYCEDILAWNELDKLYQYELYYSNLTDIDSLILS